MSNFNLYKSNRKYHFIYKTTNILTGRYYYGMHSTDDLDDNYLGSGKRLRRSIIKYGEENHKREIVEFCKDREELIKRESEIVNLNEVAKKDCMNMQLGGGGGFSSKEHQQKCGAKGRASFLNKLKDQKYSLEFAIRKSKNTKNAHKMGAYKYEHLNWTGKHHTDETKEKMSLSHKGKHIGENNSQFGTIWITNNIDENKKINKNERIPKGWTKGRKNFLNLPIYFY